MKISELIKEKFNNNKCYILLYSISKVSLGLYDNVLTDIDDFDIDDDNNLELFIFNDEKEIKKRRGFELVETLNNSDNHLDEAIFINNRFTTKYKKLIVRNHLDYNNDGIIYVKSTSFVGLEG